MTNTVLAEYWAQMRELQGQLSDRRERHLNTRPLIRKIQNLRHKIMKAENPMPKKIVRVKAESRRV